MSVCAARRRKRRQASTCILGESKYQDSFRLVTGYNAICFHVSTWFITRQPMKANMGWSGGSLVTRFALFNKVVGRLRYTFCFCVCFSAVAACCERAAYYTHRRLDQCTFFYSLSFITSLVVFSAHLVSLICSILLNIIVNQTEASLRNATGKAMCRKVKSVDLKQGILKYFT